MMLTLVILITVMLGLVMMITRWLYSGRWLGNYNTYLIKEGWHYSINQDSTFKLPIKFSFAKKIYRISVIFTQGTMVPTLGYDSSDINKLCGVSYGFDPHYRSLRVGWRANPSINKIELFAYWYVRGVRHTNWLLNVDQYEQIDIEIFQQNKKGVVAIRTINQSTIFKTELDKSWIRFKLFPYFGGNKTAPCDMKIFIKYK